MLKIKDLKTLMKLKTNNKQNELALVEETKTLYKWNGVNWEIYKSNNGLNVSLYELNQGAITSLPELNEEEILAAKALIKNYLDPSNFSYYMLLSNEKRYYTVFNIGLCSTLFPKPEDEIIDCLRELGQIKSIEINNDAIECWVTESDTSYVYYLFNYDKGVIKCQ